MTGLGLQELSMPCRPIIALSLRLVAWGFSLATAHSTITQRRFWRRIIRTPFKKRWRSPSTISSLRIPHTMRIVDRCRFSRGGYMRSSSAFPDTCSAGFITRLASGTVTLSASAASEKNGTSPLPVSSLTVGNRRLRRKRVRTILITLTPLGAVAIALPTVTANAQDRTVIVTKHRDYDRGLHRGWTRGHHYGWRNHNAKVVVIKKNRHHNYD